MQDNQYCVYIMTNTHNTVLYTGVTNDLMRRVGEHKAGKSGFTKRYNLTKLVYFERGDSVEATIWREKQIKAGSRQKKLDLINGMNPSGKICTRIFLNSQCHCERAQRASVAISA